MKGTELKAIPKIFYSGIGTHAARPAAITKREGSLYTETNTHDICQIQGGAWVVIFDYSTVGAAHAATHIGGGDPLRWALNKLLQGAGAGADPTEVDPSRVPTNGSYTGDGTNDRQIAHGLGVIPKLVIITNRSTPVWHYKLLSTDNGALYNIEINANGQRMAGITAMDTTNFSVGAATGSDAEAGNESGDVYHWVAIG